MNGDLVADCSLVYSAMIGEDVVSQTFTAELVPRGGFHQDITYIDEQSRVITVGRRRTDSDAAS